MPNPYFIKVQSGKNNMKLASDYIKAHYDYVVPNDLFENNNSKGYNVLCDHIKNIDLSQYKPIINIGGDNSVSLGTIPAMSQHYPNLKILWIDSLCDLITESEDQVQDQVNYGDITLSILLKKTNIKIIKDNFINVNNIVMLGIDNTSDVDLLNEYEIEHYTIDKIKSLGFETILDVLNDMLNGFPVHVCFDAKVFKNIDSEKMNMLINKLKSNIVSMDIIEYDPLATSKIESQQTCKDIQDIIKILVDGKDKSINIFTEDTYFLIYRNVAQRNPHDIGWYVLSNMSLQDRENILRYIPDDEILTMDIDGDDILVTKTTMNEQNKKTYFFARTINELALYPDEKESMCFKLLQI